MKKVYIQTNHECKLNMFYSSRTNAVNSLITSLKCYCEDILQTVVEVHKTKYTDSVSVFDKVTGKVYRGMVDVANVH